jgi:hypothetical protein
LLIGRGPQSERKDVGVRLSDRARFKTLLRVSSHSSSPGAEVGADLIVGHRKKSLLERWWSGGSHAYLVDQIDCSLLLARNVISEQQFREAMLKIG